MIKVTATWCICILLFATTTVHGQSVSAIIYDKHERIPVADAFVFIANSSMGVISDANGHFDLDISGIDNTDNVEFTLSHINYEPRMFKYTQITALDDTVWLTPRVIDLAETTVVEKLKPRMRARRLKTFKKEFFGRDYSVKLLTIANPEKILFQKKGDKLIATSKEPLIIKNAALGYQLQYFLRSFETYDNGDVEYKGSAFFEELDGTQKEIAKFKRNRIKAYYKTSRRFFSTLVNGTLDKSEFVIGYSSIDHNFEFVDFQEIDQGNLAITKTDENTYEIKLEGLLTIHSVHAGAKEVSKKSTAERTPYGYYSKTHVELPISYLRSQTSKIVVNQFGKVLNDAEVEEFGYWASLRTAMLLPFDYRAEP